MSKEKDFESVKNDIRALLLSAKNGLTPLELRKDYEATIGRPLPVSEFRFSSLMDLLKSMPDAVAMHKSRGTILLSAVSNESCKHVATLVARQKSTKSYNAIKSGMPAKRMMAPMPPPLPFKSKPELSSNVQLKINQLMMSYPSGLPLSKFQEAFNRRFGYYVNVSSMGFGNLLQALHTVDSIRLKLSTKENGDYLICSIPPGRNKGQFNSSLDSLEGSNLSSRRVTSVPVKTTGDPIPVEIAAQIKEVVESAQGGIWASDFPIKYKIHFDEELPFKSLGYISVVEMLGAMSNEVDLIRPVPNGDWLVFAKGKKTTSPLVGETQSQRVTPLVPNTLSRFIQNLLKNNDSTLTIAGFESFFKSKTGKDLPYHDYGFISVEELLSQVPNVSFTCSENGKKNIVYKEVKETDSDTNQDTTKLDISKITEPAPAALPKVSSSYSHVCIPFGSKAFGVYVTYVKTPSYLCVQIIGENTTHALDFLHEDIAQFYNGASGDKFIIKEPVCGMSCCARYNNDGYWYRGTVVSFEPPDVVEVRYVDYGNNAKVPLRAIRSPKPHYLALPAQAVECRLSNIIPLSNTWSKRACLVLSEMTKDKPIAAIVTSVKGSVVSLCLCDTNTDRDIHINECLVEQGLALLSSDTEREEKSIDVYKMEPPPAELSVEDTKMRLPKTASSVECVSKQQSTPHSPTELTQVFELMTNILKQQSLNATTTTTPVIPNSTVPGLPTNNSTLDLPSSNLTNNGPSTVPLSVDTSVRVPPGFENVLPHSFTTPLNTSATNSINSRPIVNNNIPIVDYNNTPSVSSNSVPPSSSTPNSSNGASIRKVSLPKPYTLHLIRYNNHPYAVSNEISSWFWESDLLQFKLFKVPNSPTGQLLHRDSIPELFQLLVDSQCPVLWEALVKETITVYSLEMLPMIVNAIECPAVLSTALKSLVEEWKEKGQEFWNSNILYDIEILQREKAIDSHIKKLQQERTALLSSLTEKSNSEGSSISTGETFSKFMALDKKIEELKKKLTTLNKSTRLSSGSSNDSCDDLSDHSNLPSPPALANSKPLSVAATPFSPQSPPSKPLPSKPLPLSQEKSLSEQENLMIGQQQSMERQQRSILGERYNDNNNSRKPNVQKVPPIIQGQVMYSSPNRIPPGPPYMPYGPPLVPPPYHQSILPTPSYLPLPPSPYYGGLPHPLPPHYPSPPPVAIGMGRGNVGIGRGKNGNKKSILLGPGFVGAGMSNNYQGASMNII